MRRSRLLFACFSIAVLGLQHGFGADSLVLAEPAPLPYSLAGRPIPSWSGGALVAPDSSGTGSPSILAFDRQGRQIFSAALTIPGSARTYVVSWARGLDGTIAVCGSSWAADGRGAPYIALFSPDGRTEQVIRTAPYTPYLIAIAPDGTLWAEGFEMINLSLKGTNANNGVIRHFDRSGSLLGMYVPGSTFANPIRLMKGRLVTSSDRIGWVNFEAPAGQGSYVEISSDGTITTFPLPDFGVNPAVELGGLAMTGGNEVILAIERGRVRSVDFYELDRRQGRFTVMPTPTAISTAKWATLYGADGSDLVLGLPPNSSAIVWFYSLVR